MKLVMSWPHSHTSVFRSVVLLKLAHAYGTYLNDIQMHAPAIQMLVHYAWIGQRTWKPVWTAELELSYLWTQGYGHLIWPTWVYTTLNDLKVLLSYQIYLWPCSLCIISFPPLVDERCFNLFSKMTAYISCHTPQSIGFIICQWATPLGSVISHRITVSQQCLEQYVSQVLIEDWSSTRRVDLA